MISFVSEGFPGGFNFWFTGTEESQQVPDTQCVIVNYVLIETDKRP